MNRSERRRLDRETTIKGWVIHPSPKQLSRGIGWFGELDRVFRSEDSKYVVMIRTFETSWGTVEHACMRNTDSADIP